MISFITFSCNDTQVKPIDVDPVDPVVIVPPTYSINVSLNNIEGKYSLDVSNDKEWIVTFTPFDNYEVKDVLENGVSLGKIKTYSYKRNKDVNLKVVFGFVHQMLQLTEPTWRVYQAYDTNTVTHEIQYIYFGEVYGTRTLKFRVDGKIETNTAGNVFVFDWKFINDEKTIILLALEDIVRIKYEGNGKILTFTTIWPGDTAYTTVVKYYDNRYPKPG